MGPLGIVICQLYLIIDLMAPEAGLDSRSELDPETPRSGELSET